MHSHDDALSVGVTAADIAWPLILAICFALMVLPFAFWFIVQFATDSDNASDDAPE